MVRLYWYWYDGISYFINDKSYLIVPTGYKNNSMSNCTRIYVVKVTSKFIVSLYKEKQMSKLSVIERCLQEIVAIAFTDKDVRSREELLLLMTEYFENPSNVVTARARIPHQSWSFDEINRRRNDITELASPIIHQALLSIDNFNIKNDCKVNICENLKDQLMTWQNTKFQSNKIKMIVLGLHGVGKSTLIEAIKGNKNPNCQKSTGFHPKKARINDQDVIFYDIGRSCEMQQAWTRYFHDVHAIIFMVDASASKDEWDKSFDVFKKVIAHEAIKNKPTLLLLNKVDLQNSSQRLQSTCSQFTSTSNIKFALGSVNPLVTGGALDSRITDAFQWLLSTINNQFDSLESQRRRN